MSNVQMLRSLVNQRLTNGEEEIFALFETTIAEYEEQAAKLKEENERLKKLVNAVSNPRLRLHTTDIEQLLLIKDEPQECSPGVELDPEQPNIKAEEPGYPIATQYHHMKGCNM
ncbi:uncharacterized protein ACO6RY_16745 [Pungitius sinensis]